MNQKSEFIDCFMSHMENSIQQILIFQKITDFFN